MASSNWRRRSSTAAPELAAAWLTISAPRLLEALRARRRRSSPTPTQTATSSRISPPRTHGEASGWTAPKPR